MKKTLDLCRPCAERTGEKYDMKTIKTGVNRKVTCEMCHRRKFGSRYELKRKKSEVSA